MKESRPNDVNLINIILKIGCIGQYIVLTKIYDNKLTPFLIVVWGQFNQIFLFHDGPIKETSKK